MDSIFSVVSVDVLACRYDRKNRRVLLAGYTRDADPFLGTLALPGVVVRSGERIDQAASRAIGKLGAELPEAHGQLRTFDEPSRDPRGPSLSIAVWAVMDPDEHPSLATWLPVEDPGALAFDHTRIIADCRPLLADHLWRDLAFTRALTGGEFTGTDAVVITEQLSGATVHRANLNRELTRTPGLADAGTGVGLGPRPPKLWRWEAR